MLGKQFDEPICLPKIDTVILSWDIYTHTELYFFIFSTGRMEEEADNGIQGNLAREKKTWES